MRNDEAILRDEFYKRIGSNLYSLRMKAELKPSDIGMQLGIRYQRYHAWELHRAHPPIYFLSMLAKFYQVTVDQLIHEEL